MAAKFLDHNNRDDDEDGKKVIGLYKQNNNFARARFLYISKPSMHDCDTILSISRTRFTKYTNTTKKI